MLWFTPKCPVDDETREWIDNAFQWLIDELGADTARDVPVILPTEDYFPDPYNGTRVSVRRMLDRICGYMDVDPEMVGVRFFENDDGSKLHQLAADGMDRNHVLGTYHMRRDGKYSISLDISQATNPEVMVATIAHELGHVILLGEGRLNEDYEDHEPMTDLVTVFYGLGIFNANSSFVFEQWTNSQFQGWRAGRAGYMSEEMFGYALALFARHRGETKPEWSKFLSTNVRSYMKSSLRFIGSAKR